MASIVHFGKYYEPDVGGIESVTLSNAIAAAAKGHHVTVVCFRKTPAALNEIRQGIRVLRAPIAALIASQPMSFRYLWLCLLEARKADIVHLHAPNMLGAFCSLLIGRRPALLVHWHSDVIGKGALGLLLRPLERLLLRRANHVVAGSGAYAQASGLLSPLHRKTTAIPYGVPDRSVSVVEDDVALPERICQFIGVRRLIVSVGRLVSYKGFEVLIHAASKLPPDAVVIIVGNGPLREKLQELIESSGVSDRVLLAGRLDDPVLDVLYKKALIYCMPSISRAEAFGVVLPEAMTFSLPIVATEIPGSGVPWVNLHGVSGLNVLPGDANALAQACTALLTDEQMRKRLGVGARRRYEMEFSEALSTTRMLDLYDRLLSNPVAHV